MLTTIKDIVTKLPPFSICRSFLESDNLIVEFQEIFSKSIRCILLGVVIFGVINGIGVMLFLYLVSDRKPISNGI